MSFDIAMETIVSIGSAVSLGVIANMLFAKKIEQEKVQEKKVEEISSSINAKMEEAKFRVIESLAQKLPQGSSADEITRTLSQNIRIGGDLVIQGGSPTDVSLVQDLVNGYHQQALSQAKVQFWFSVLAATVGFAYILYAATNISPDQLATYFNIMPGAVIDGVAFLFFRQAEQTRERATALYDRLRSDNQMAKAREMVESIDDQKMRSAVKAQMALHMAGLKPKEIELPTFVTPDEK